jgi:hypothetical protein
VYLEPVLLVFSLELINTYWFKVFTPAPWLATPYVTAPTIAASGLSGLV